MVQIELDGEKVEVAPGSMVMHAAEKAGVYIPHFCYHKKLSIAANCRMCLVDVEKAPKPMPACATPVTQGMVVRTKSDKAIKAQQSVMEFLLINHPLDCPICDQGGECQLQDIAVGYGGGKSRYAEEKRVVMPKDVGPLISMEEMSRCIHCTRCVRFGQEIAGDMELGMSHRGEHAEIETFLGQTVDSELSGNMIDICPVGALTSKPFRYSARTWEMSRRKSVSPHDSTGANLIAQVKGQQVMRVVPFENEAVNECWIADRDRYSYEALASADRLTVPMIKQGGEWRTVDWTTALEYVANGLSGVKRDHGAAQIGALVSPHSTVEELALAARLLRAVGSDHIDHRLRYGAASAGSDLRWLGRPIVSLSGLDAALVVGSNLRKDHPLFAQRIRQAARAGARVFVMNHEPSAWAMPTAAEKVVSSGQWVHALAGIATAVAEELGISSPTNVAALDVDRSIAKGLISGSQKAVLLGNAAAHHACTDSLAALGQWIAQHVGATFGFLCEAANTVGAQLVGAQPQTAGGASAHDMLLAPPKALLLLNVEPGQDTAGGADVAARIAGSELVVTMSAFKTNLDCSDVLLPIAPFTETAGSFVNAEGRLQSFHAVVRPLGETRPAWKVLRALGSMLGLDGFDEESSADVLNKVFPAAKSGDLVVQAAPPSKAALAPIDWSVPSAEPCVASIYRLDPLVRRAPALQQTADARCAAASAGS